MQHVIDLFKELLLVGALRVVWPALAQTLFAERAFLAHGQGVVRVIGLTVVVIGWLYLFGGRSGDEQVVAASVVDRLIFVPLVLLPLASAGGLPAFAAGLRGSRRRPLAIGAWMIAARGAHSKARHISPV